MSTKDHRWVSETLLSVKQYADENELFRLSEHMKSALVDFYYDISKAQAPFESDDSTDEQTHEPRGRSRTQ